VVEVAQREEGGTERDRSRAKTILEAIFDLK
jgi:hypothetical protein